MNRCIFLSVSTPCPKVWGHLTITPVCFFQEVWSTRLSRMFFAWCSVTVSPSLAERTRPAPPRINLKTPSTTRKTWRTFETWHVNNACVSGWRRRPGGAEAPARVQRAAGAKKTQEAEDPRAPERERPHAARRLQGTAGWKMITDRVMTWR